MTRPAELLFGPIGAVSLESVPEGIKVICRNGLTKKFNSFVTTTDIASKISIWKNAGGNIQDMVPELSIENREMCISGISPEEWKDI